MVQTRNIEQYKHIHETQKYGRTDRRIRALILRPIAQAGARSILDYGAGQSNFVDKLMMPGLGVRHRYDPAISSISSIPLSHYDVVICTDVLEHLDDGEIDLVLAQIATLSDKAIFAADSNEATTVLPNGESAHATLQPIQWWVSKIAKTFPNTELISSERGRAMIRTWRPTVWEKLVGDLKFLVAAFANRKLTKSKANSVGHSDLSPEAS